MPFSLKKNNQATNPFIKVAHFFLLICCLISLGIGLGIALKTSGYMIASGVLLREGLLLSGISFLVAIVGSFITVYFWLKKP